jgi:ketosteroid isomerase-like protein
MKSLAIVILALISSLVVCGQQKDTLSVVYRDSADSEFDQIAERWLAAYNGPDAELLTPLYTEDAQYISGHVVGLVANGRERVIANFRRGMNIGGHLDGLEVLLINHSCELATVLCKYNANNSGQKVSGRTLLILKKIDGKWLIAIHMTVV